MNAVSCWYFCVVITDVVVGGVFVDADGVVMYVAVVGAVVGRVVCVGHW